MSESENLVWQEPPTGRRWHIFDEDDEESLCGNWLLKTEAGAKTVCGYEDVQESDNIKDGRDCKTCARKADLLDEDGGDDE